MFLGFGVVVVVVVVVVNVVVVVVVVLVIVVVRVVVGVVVVAVVSRNEVPPLPPCTTRPRTNPRASALNRLHHSLLRGTLGRLAGWHIPILHIPTFHIHTLPITILLDQW